MVSKSSPWLLLSLTLSLGPSPSAVSPVAGFGIGHRLVLGPSRSSSSPLTLPTFSRSHPLSSRSDKDDDDCQDATAHPTAMSRHAFLLLSSSVSTSLALVSLSPSPAQALVKGNAPPPPKKSSTDATSSSGKKCRNVEECQEQAEQAEALRLQREKERMESGKGPKVGVTEGGVRYLDVVDEDEEENGDADNGAKTKKKEEEGSASVMTVKQGDTIEIYYKVLKLGKRSYDGLSGEGTVVFSRGYGLEDDENTFGDKSFVFTVGDASVIDALNEGVVGMTFDANERTRRSKRRISIAPQKGWEKSTPQCDGGPGGSGAGGELRTDYVVVPTATMVDQEACFDRAKRPFPGTYAQERRMAQRFDQSLIVEVVLAGVRR